MKYCPNCGYLNSDYAKYCIKCGYKLDQAPKVKTGYTNREKILASIAITLLVIAIILLVLPMHSSKEITNNQSFEMLSLKEADAIFGINWTLTQLQYTNYLTGNPPKQDLYISAISTTIIVPYNQINYTVTEEMVGVKGVKVFMNILIVKLIPNNNVKLPSKIEPPSWITILPSSDWSLFGFYTTQYEGYNITLCIGGSILPDTTAIIFNKTTIIKISIEDYRASISQIEEVIDALT